MTKSVIIRKLSYRENDRSMRPIYGSPKNFPHSLTTPTTTFNEILIGFWSDRSYECAYKAYKIWSSYSFLPVPEIIASSYRPISNLSVLSKLLERLVVRQLLDYLTSADLLPTLQSGFRSGHSTETAILRVPSDIILAWLAWFSWTCQPRSARSTTTSCYSVCGRRSASMTYVAHQWIRSYLSGWTQRVRHGYKKSTLTRLMCGVPQGSVLGPILFVLYTVDLISLIESHMAYRLIRGRHTGVRLMPACWRSLVFHETIQMRRRNVRLDEVKQAPCSRTPTKPRFFGERQVGARTNYRPPYC